MQKNPQYWGRPDEIPQESSLPPAPSLPIREERDYIFKQYKNYVENILKANPKHLLDSQAIDCSIYTDHFLEKMSKERLKHHRLEKVVISKQIRNAGYNHETVSLTDSLGRQWYLDPVESGLTVFPGPHVYGEGTGYRWRTELFFNLLEFFGTR